MARAKVPVMPVREKRGEYVVMVPPSMEVEIICRKLWMVRMWINTWLKGAAD